MKTLLENPDHSSYPIPETDIAAVLANNPVYKDLLPRLQMLQSIVGRRRSSWCQAQKSRPRMLARKLS